MSRNKLYTAVSVTGFSVSLMFVILLGVYVKNELSVDDFHEKGDRIYLMSHDDNSSFSLPVGNYVVDKCPEAEAYARVVFMTDIVETKTDEKIKAKVLLTDASFFSMFSFPLLEGSVSQVFSEGKSVVLSRSFALKLFGDRSPIGERVKTERDITYTVSGVLDDFPQNSHLSGCDMIVNFDLINAYYSDRYPGLDILNYWFFAVFLFIYWRGRELICRRGFLFYYRLSKRILFCIKTVILKICLLFL